MKQQISNNFLLTLCIFLLLPHIITADQTNIVETACQKSTDKEFCISSLKSDPDSKNSDITGLAYIALKLASSSALNTTFQIKKLLGDSSNLDPFTEQYLTDCSEHYADAIDQIDDSLAAVSVNAYNDVGTWLDAAIVDAESCEEGFKEQPDNGHANLVLTQNNKVLRQLCDNALVIVKMLPAKH